MSKENDDSRKDEVSSAAAAAEDVERESNFGGDNESPAYTDLPPPNFSSFVLSISTSVLIDLGEMANPNTNQVSKQLEMARHSIDLLAMLKEKTSGNLTEDEAALIENVVSDLRLRYCEADS